ncbi:hypothetical protein QTP70_021889 [Hemibagrus guttatus]|uniref:Uncharacterized protein n=1 Tax=Hemibagrus guttatus TaxID=175788 RepID=A0AAE0PQQ7_9TELE|nr:hypothetical protein QTP70_021889 [Hemibagrus guttatus]
MIELFVTNISVRNFSASPTNTFVFMAAIDRYTLKLLKLYRKGARKGAFGHEMEEFLERLDESFKIVNQRRTAALEDLPLFLRENPSKLFKKCKVFIKDFKWFKAGVSKPASAWPVSCRV